MSPIVRREQPRDVAAVRSIVAAAFAGDDGTEPMEVRLLDALRLDAGWMPALSWVAAAPDGALLGHVVCSRATVDDAPVVALGPLAVTPEAQRTGVGSALVHAVVGAADALEEPLVALLGHLDYYPRFGFVPALELGVRPPEPAWGAHFQALPLSAHRPDLTGAFRYCAAFDVT